MLSYPKFELSEKEIKELIQEEILPYAKVVKPKGRLRVVRRDPSDNKFLECAVAGKARVIVSGDKDVLSLGRYRQIRIQIAGAVPCRSSGSARLVAVVRQTPLSEKTSRQREVNRSEK